MKGFGGSAFLAAIALVAGTAVGYCLAPGAAQEAAPDAGRTARLDRAPIADNGEAASVKALRARVAELERILAEKQMAEEAAATNAIAAAPRPPEPGRGRGREWMEDLKKSNPERYAQITNHFAQMRRQREERQRRNLDFLASVDTSRMSSEMKKTHYALQKRLALREELLGQLHASFEDPNTTEEHRRAVSQQMRENEELLRDLQREERSNLFEATANTLGFEGDDAKDIVTTLEDVVEATDSSWGPHRGRTRGRPPSQ